MVSTRRKSAAAAAGSAGAGGGGVVEPLLEASEKRAGETAQEKEEETADEVAKGRETAEGGQAVEAAAAADEASSSDDESESEDEAEDASAAANAAAGSPGPKVSNLALRIMGGLGLGVLFGSCTFGGAWPFACLLAFTCFECCREYLSFVTQVPKRAPAPPRLVRLWLRFVVVGVILGTQLGVRSGIFEVATFCLLAALLLVRSNKKRKNKVRISEITSLVFGLVYCGYLPSFWVKLRSIAIMAPAPIFALPGFLEVRWTLGLLSTVLPVLCIVSADTFAYLGGRRFGKTPLTSISPKKTVEGAFCGLLGSLACALTCDALTHWPGQPIIAVGLACVVFVGSVFGDLIESSMKRAAGMKDSGDIIPGHGGVLDRFDSYIFTGALVYFYLFWVLWIDGIQLSPLLSPGPGAIPR